MLPLDKEIHRIEKTADTYGHVVIQEVGSVRDLQVDRRIIVLELELHLSLEKEPVGQLPQKKCVEGSVEKRIFAAPRGEAGGAMTVEEMNKQIPAAAALAIGSFEIGAIARFIYLPPSVLM